MRHFQIAALALSLVTLRINAYAETAVTNDSAARPQDKTLAVGDSLHVITNGDFTRIIFETVGHSASGVELCLRARVASVDEKDGNYELSIIADDIVFKGATEEVTLLLTGKVGRESVKAGVYVLADEIVDLNLKLRRSESVKDSAASSTRSHAADPVSFSRAANDETPNIWSVQPDKVRADVTTRANSAFHISSKRLACYAIKRSPISDLTLPR